MQVHPAQAATSAVAGAACGHIEHAAERQVARRDVSQRAVTMLPELHHIDDRLDLVEDT